MGLKYLFFLLTIFFIQCRQVDNRCILNSPDKIVNYGIDFNAVRQKIGLPIVVPSEINDTVRWNKGVFWPFPDKPHYFQKVIEFSCDSIIVETDEYRDNVEWNGLNGEKLVSISISYYFDKSKSPNKATGFVCRIDTIDPKRFLTDSTFIDLKQAETYLSNWGVKRLN